MSDKQTQMQKDIQQGVIFFDMSYSLKMIQKRKIYQALEARELNGFFANVISVHPLAGIFENEKRRFGHTVLTPIKKNHLFVEGKIGITRFLSWLPVLNLLLAQIEMLFLLVQLAGRKRISVVRIGDPYYLGILGLFISAILHVPLAIRVNCNYDLQYQETKKPAYPKIFRLRIIEKIIERFIFSKCDLVAGANQNNLNYAIANGARPECGVVFRYGNLIHPIHFQKPEERPEADSLIKKINLPKIFCMTIARLEPVKKVEHTLLIIKRLREKGINIGLLLVGDGSLRKKMEEFSKINKLEDVIYFSGNQSQEWIGRVLPKASLVISPHMGRALVEACLAERPIIAYDFEWQKEIIQNGKTGILVEENNCEGMATWAEKCIQSPVKYLGMGRAARKTVLRQMNPVHLTKEEVSAYKKILKNKKKRD